MSLTVVVPALNEEHNLAATVDTVRRVVPTYFREWEILIFDDGSTDRTAEIADRLAAQDPRVRAFHHRRPVNLGGCYKRGIEAARGELLILIPGDNECGEELMHSVLSVAGTAEIIAPFTVNPEVRPWPRRLISSAFTAILNLISGHSLRYYNGAVLHRTARLKEVELQTDGFGYQAEILVKLLRRGVSCREIPTRITSRAHGSSKALRLKNIAQVLALLCRLARPRPH